MTVRSRSEAVKPIGILLSLSHRLQAGDSIPDVRIQSRAAAVEMRQDRGAHPRIPEFADMIGDPRHRLVVALTLKEFANLVGHVDQAVRRHEGFPWRQRSWQFGQDG